MGTAGGNPSRWRRIFRLGIRQKVVLILLSTLLVTLTVSGWLTLRAHQQDIIDETNRRGAELTQVIANNLAYRVVGHDYHTIELLLKELVTREDIVYARVLSAKGNIMADVGEARKNDQGLVMFREDIRLGNEVVGKLLLGLSAERITRTLEQHQQTLVQREVIVILIISVIEFLALSYFIVRPITVISRSLGADPGSDMRTIPIRSNDEFGRMASEFNRLRAALETKVALANQELQHANAELERLTITDPLTGLHNRRYFETLMEQEVALAVRHHETGSIILVDIDGFKQLNDRYGHDVGDAIIREVGQILQNRIRRTDALCRIGGEEFFILCRHTDSVQVTRLAEELCAAIARQPLAVVDQSVSVTVSLGAATLSGDLKIATQEEFFKCADRALYHSKQQGRNRATHCSTLPEDRPPILT